MKECYSWKDLMVTSNQILAIETSSYICGVSIFKNNEMVSLVQETVDRKHAEIIPLFIEKVVSDSGVSLSKLNAIAVSIGPGSFTGLRIGLGFAKGIAYANRLPIIPIPTMTAMAFGLKNQKPKKGISLSHSNKVFYQEYNWNNSFPNSMEKPIVDKFESIKQRISSDDLVFQWNCEKLLSCRNNFFHAAPSAENIGKLASIKFDDWKIHEPFYMVPEYIAPFMLHSKK